MAIDDGDRSGLTRRGALLAGAGLAMASAAPAAAGTEDLDFASAAEAARAIRTGKVSSRELTGRMLKRIAAFNPKLDAVVNVLTDQAMAEAARADAARSSRAETGPLHGVPILIKDAFEIAGVPTSGGVKQLAQYRPATDSEVVRRLRAAGAVLLGNTNVPFVLNDWQSYNDIYGTTNNPWDLARTPGGSSGGSAAALAAGLGYFSPGSDRSGSLRVPASFCGVYAHKPSLGVVPLRGWFPSPPGSGPNLADPISVAGPMGRSAADLRIGMQAMGGPDGDDARAWRWSMPAPRQTRLSDYRVGYVLDDPACPVDPPVRERLEAAVAALAKAGVKLKQGWPAGIDPAAQHRAYLYMMFSSIGSPPGIKPDDLKPLAARDDGSMASIFAQTVVDPISRYVAHEREALRARAAWRAAFQDIDVFLTPTSFVAAFPHDHSEPQGARRLSTRAGPRAYTDLFFWIACASLAGLPATAAPAGRTAGGLPVGMQILGPYMEDATPIDFAERAAEVLGGFVPRRTTAEGRPMTLQPLLQAPPLIQLHVATAMAALACGVWLIFMSRKGAAGHRTVGALFLGLMAVTAVLSFFIHRRMPDSPVLGLSPAHLMSALVLFSVWRAWDGARNGHVRRHRFWATGLFAGALVINGLSNIFFVSGITHDVFFGP